MLKRNSFGSKYVSVHTKDIAAEANLAGGQFLLEEYTLSCVCVCVCVYIYICQAGTGRTAEDII
jgi:hypothetical protein